MNTEYKIRDHFTLLTNPAGVLQIPRLETYLQELLSLAVGVFEEPNFSYNSQTSKFIISGRSKSILVEEFLERMLAEPGPQTFSWLKVFHRMVIVENVRHQVKCEGCKREPIIGLRYKCTRCPRYNLCQDCFWTGITTDAHTNSHDVKEYTTSTKQHSRQFGHSLRKSFQFVRQHSTVSSGASSSSEATGTPEGGTMPRTTMVPALVPCSPHQRLPQARPPGFPTMQAVPQQHKIVGSSGGNHMRYPPVRTSSYDCSLPMQMSYYCTGLCGAPGPQPISLGGTGSNSFNETLILHQQPFYPHFAGCCMRPGRPPNTPVLSHAREARQQLGMQVQMPTGPAAAAAAASVSEIPPTPIQPNSQQRPVMQPSGKVPQNSEELQQRGMLPQKEQLPQRARGPSVGPLPANQRLTQRHNSMPEGPHHLVPPESPTAYRALSHEQETKPMRVVAPETNQAAVCEAGNPNRGGTAANGVDATAGTNAGRPGVVDTVPQTLTPTDDNAASRGGTAQPADEHSMIANYAARLAALKGLNGQFGDMNHVFDCTQTQRQLVAQLEAKNREILLEIQRLRLEQQQQAAGIAAAMVAGGRPNLGSMRPGVEPGAAGDGRSDTLGRHPESEDPQLMAELQALRQRKSTLEARMNDLQGNRRDLMIQLETLMRLLKTGSDNYQSHEEVLSFPAQPLPPESSGGFEGSLSHVPPGLVSYYTQSRSHGAGMNPPRRSSSLVRRSRGEGSLDHLPPLLHRSLDAESVLRSNTSTETPFLEPFGETMCSLRRPYGRPKAYPAEASLSPRHGFERSGSQPPSLESSTAAVAAAAASAASGTFTRPRTASQSYAHQRGALTPTADPWRSGGTLGRPPVHPKVTTSASSASPYRSVCNAKPTLTALDTPGSAGPESTMKEATQLNQFSSSANQAATSCW
ncbi:unnamed protein product [Schistocephalus solidus]|uniref:ZZ-type domain-containing protein n=1 Tax=Schistocephalus solidus TaxID=70667 RepID=A0A183SL94_SCHSO|nr:unnamed protein product [Schistocephalus solidus]